MPWNPWAAGALAPAQPWQQVAQRGDVWQGEGLIPSGTSALLLALRTKGVLCTVILYNLEWVSNE